ncbi:MAG TPA: thioredoxin family protein [Bacillales bacterium]|nr:thioredoxin family protein [Bacillales bacterium]
MLRNLSAEQLQQMNEGNSLVYFYTPLCGTCAKAERLLNLTLEAMPGVCVYACNLNFAPEVAIRWKIESVPCLIRLRNGDAEAICYAFEPLTRIYDFIKKHAN